MQIRAILLFALIGSLSWTVEVSAQSLFSGSTGTLGGTNTGGQQTGTQDAQGQSASGVNTGQALGTTNLNSADGSLSATVGQGGFVGGQNNGTFTGNRFAGQTASQSNQAQFGNLQNGNNNRNQNGNNQNRTDRKPVRPQYRIAFTAPAIPRTDIQSRLELSRIQLPLALSQSDAVTVRVGELGVVTLSGKVATERDRKLLESYVRMEPGVRSVNNTLSVSE